jgi:hypothetical protein
MPSCALHLALLLIHIKGALIASSTLRLDRSTHRISACANLAYLLCSPSTQNTWRLHSVFCFRRRTKLTVHGILDRHGFAILHNAMHCHEDRLEKVFVVVANNLP